MYATLTVCQSNWLNFAVLDCLCIKWNAVNVIQTCLIYNELIMEIPTWIFLIKHFQEICVLFVAIPVILFVYVKLLHISIIDTLIECLICNVDRLRMGEM